MDFTFLRIYYILIQTPDSDSVVINELIEFLNSEILIVKSIENPDYVKLHNYYEEFVNRMKERFIN